MQSTQETIAPGGSARIPPAPVAAAGISKRFVATQALDDVSIEIRDRESHALVGRNGAGKSTLVACLTGMLSPDAGEVLFDGEPAPPLAARELWRRRVACVYQKSTAFSQLSVAENLFLNTHATNRGRIRWRALRRDAAELLEQWEIDVDIMARVADLSVEQQQLIEIARALSLGTRFIILDEPTAKLDGREIARLFERIVALQDAGVTFLYISHHLNEIYEVCQRITVLRDGRLVATAAVSDMPEERLVEAMVGDATGSPTSHRAPRAVRPEAPAGATALQVSGLTLDAWFRDVELEVAPGECVGLAGLAGSGKAEVADCIVGMLRPDGGAIAVEGRPVQMGRVDRAIAAGIGYVPQDRHARGLAPNLSVEENVTLTIAGKLGRVGLISPQRRRRAAAGLIDELGIVQSSSAQLVSELSGGNQQKVVLGRALATHPKVLVLVSPTSGVDVASKQTLLEAVERHRDAGAGVLVVSDELEDLRVCDRVLVMFDGSIVASLTAGWQDHDMVSKMEGVDGNDG